MNKFMKKAEGFFTSRGFSAGVVTAIVVALVIVVNVIIYALTSILGLYFYTPVVRDYGISGVTDAVFSEAEESGKKVTITFCMASDDLDLHTTGKYVHATARAYAERYDFIELRYVNLLTQMETLEDGTRRFVDLSGYKHAMPKPDGTVPCSKCGERFVRGSDADGKCKHEEAETPLLTHSVIFQHEGGSYKVLTDAYTTSGFADFFTLDSTGQPYAYSGEEVMGAMISWVCQRHDQRKTAYFTENHGETVDVTFGNLLTAAGYYIDTVNLRTENVPEDAGLVVISNPVSDFERAAEGSGVYTEIERLGDYLKRGEGGNLYLALDAYSDKLTNLEALIAEYGITVAGGSGEYDYSRELVLDPTEAIALDGMSFIASFGDGAFANRLTSAFAPYNTGRVLLSRVARLNIDASLGAESVLMSSDTSHTVFEGSVKDGGGGFTVAAYSKRTEGDATSEVFVIPSVLMTNSDILVASGYSNRDFVYSLLEVMCDSDSSLYGTKSVIYNTGIVENLTQRTATVFTVILLLIPAALAVFGIVVVKRRKRR